ncbi:MAG: hypothetical protein KDC16_00860 [Saprospiraceae bacterium]|nr:hypothetical protein [Saprospiraceae bacterium]MCB9328493.1 hypothetical protein [Lewinellaceae bacterium]HPK10063.1 hypothetical protein [Saprospiraceae bacterium]
MNYKVTLVGILFLILVSCGKETDDGKLDLGQDYFPLIEENFLEYRSDSIVVDDNGQKIDTLVSYLKEVIGEPFVDLEGDTTFKVYRYFKRNFEDAYKLSNVWIKQINADNAQSVENNLRFVKLAFPLTETQRWDGNIYIPEDQITEISGEPIEIYVGWKYKVKELDKPYSLENQNYNQTVLIEQANFETAISLRESSERYARGIGLIEKNMRIYDTQNSNAAIPWEERAEAGFSHTLKLINHN